MPEADGSLFPIDQVRARFPALATHDGDRPRIYFDAPGGTQVCDAAIARMVAHLETGTANAGGAFASSCDTVALSEAAHGAMADLLNGDAGDFTFGPNMTSLTLALSRALSGQWNAGDEIVLTRLDHDANVTPWVLAARDRDVVVKWLDFDVETGRLRLNTLPQLLTDKTQLVAIGGASNVLGTLNDVTGMVWTVREYSDALVFVDAVQSVPHVVTDVQALGADFLACSPYKFFGPHQGVLWSRSAVMEELEVYKLRPSPTRPSGARLETGTQSFEGQAGVLGTIEYLQWLGQEIGDHSVKTRREALVQAIEACFAYELMLGERLLAGLRTIAGVSIFGPAGMEGRVPTFAFTMNGHEPAEIARHLGDNGVNAWSGHFYGVEPLTRLGLIDRGGLVRVGLCHYNTTSEVDRFLELLDLYVNS